MNFKARILEKLDEDVTCYCCMMTRDELIEDNHDIIQNTTCCNHFICDVCLHSIDINRCGYCRRWADAETGQRVQVSEMVWTDSFRHIQQTVQNWDRERQAASNNVVNVRPFVPQPVQELYTNIGRRSTSTSVFNFLPLVGLITPVVVMVGLLFTDSDRSRR